MKLIILFLVLIIVIAIFKKSQPYKETFTNALIESSDIYDKTNSVIDSIKNLWNSLFSSTQTIENLEISTTGGGDPLPPGPEGGPLPPSPEGGPLPPGPEGGPLSPGPEGGPLPPSPPPEDTSGDNSSPNDTYSSKRHPHHNIDHTLKKQIGLLNSIESEQQKLIKQLSEQSLNHLENKNKKVRRRIDIDDRYILKTAITACPPPIDMNNYVLKSSLMPPKEDTKKIEEEIIEDNNEIDIGGEEYNTNSEEITSPTTTMSPNTSPSTTMGGGGSGQMPDSSGQMPDSSGGMPDSSGGMPDSSGQMPDSSGQMPDSSGQMPDSSGGMPDSSGQMPDSSGQETSTENNQQGWVDNVSRNRIENEDCTHVCKDGYEQNDINKTTPLTCEPWDSAMNTFCVIGDNVNCMGQWHAMDTGEKSSCESNKQPYSTDMQGGSLLNN